MNPEVKIKISALDSSQAAFKSVEKNIAKVEGSTRSFKDKLESLQPTFKKMAATGAVAFGAITAGVTKMTQDAAKAEGSWNKFNTVFADGADDMRDWIADIRKEMPLANHEIARMSADLQDLLVPMGLSRDSAQDMTQGFVDLANKLAAFNDVDPTEVLEAFKSGLSGSSEPLRRFGINALDSSIELEALNTGLIEAGSKLTDLDPITRNQVKAQALLTLAVDQSADAINGFEVNNDSLIRRQQALQATLSELSVTIGTVFLPIIDDAVKAIAPVVERVSAWVKENPELTRNIIIATAAIAGLVAVVGAIGIALLAFNPIVLMIIGTIAGIAAIVYSVRNAIEMFSGVWTAAWEGIKNIAGSAVDWIVNKVQSVIDMVQDALDALASLPGVKQGISITKNAFRSVSDLFRADGGPVSGNTPYIVGERGPELFVPKSGGTIVPNHDLGGGGGNTFVFNVQGDITDRVKTDIMRDLQRQMRLA